MPTTATLAPVPAAPLLNTWESAVQDAFSLDADAAFSIAPSTKSPPVVSSSRLLRNSSVAPRSPETSHQVLDTLSGAASPSQISSIRTIVHSRQVSPISVVISLSPCLSQSSTSASAEATSELLRELVTSYPRARSAFLSHDGLASCSSALSTHLPIHAVATEAVLRLVASLLPGARAADTAADAPALVGWALSALRQWGSAVRSLRIAALSALAMLCENGRSAKQRLSVAGGVPLVCDALVAARDDPRALEAACEAAAAAARDDVELSAALGEAGAVEATVEGLRAAPFDASVAAAVAPALRVLCVHGKNRERLSDCGGTLALTNALVCAALRARAGDARGVRDTVEELLLGLGNSCLGCATNVAAVVRQDALEAVLCAMVVYKGDAEVTEAGVRLWRIVTSGKGGEFGKRGSGSAGIGRRKRPIIVLLERAIGAATEALAAHMDDKGVVQHACALMWNVCALGRTNIIRSRPEIEVVVKKVVEKHAVDEDVVKVAVALVQSFK